jgi:L-rhamnose isomerase
MRNDRRVEQAYDDARERYAELGVDCGKALEALARVPLSLHCWQGDDVVGLEGRGSNLAGSGLAVTGRYPGRARNIAELRQDLDKAYSLIPGRHRLNLHAMYGDWGEKVPDRDEIRPEHYAGWAGWARERGLGVDFNATVFGHPKAESGFTLSSGDEAVRRFWVKHVKRCREVSAWFGRELGSPCIHNLWIPDGAKEAVPDRWERRALLKRSLDEAYAQAYPPAEMKDAVESKLWGIGSESFVTGSHEFYLGYALTHGKMVCLDTGHFHPTESVADKMSAILQFSDELLLHVSRGVRWDSDHIVVSSDELVELCREVVRARALSRVHFALDYFDAGVNRVGAWVLGARATLKAILSALLEPEAKPADGISGLSLYEQLRAMPLGAVWDYYCLQKGVPSGDGWLVEVQTYEKEVLSDRDR